MTQQVIQRKRAAGYMSCMILMFTMASTYPASKNADIIPASDSQVLVSKDAIEAYKRIPKQSQRVYQVDNKVISVDTSKSGWAVSLLLAEDSSSN
jgi:hypothetical protein